MAKRGWKRVHRVVWCSLVTPAVLIGWPVASAQAQAVQGCQPDQFLDRTAPGADRLLSWAQPIATDPERCMQVRAGQTVVWNTNTDETFGDHPLVGSPSDPPNPISSNLPENSDTSHAVTFNAPGTFGYFCSAHTPMKGAIKVVAAPAVPALSPWMTVGLTMLLLASGWALTGIHRRGRAAAVGG